MTIRYLRKYTENFVPKKNLNLSLIRPWKLKSTLVGSVSPRLLGLIAKIVFAPTY